MAMMDTDPVAAIGAAQILIVVDDADLAADLAQQSIERFDAQIAVVGTIAEARPLLASEEYDVALVAHDLPDGHALALAADASDADTPLILLDSRLDADRVLAALRSGVTDVQTAPIDLDQLATTMEVAIAARQSRRREAARSRRLRRVSTRMMRERRELRTRIDLICRDLVHAYRRLAEKVIEHTQVSNSQDASTD